MRGRDGVERGLVGAVALLTAGLVAVSTGVLPADRGDAGAGSGPATSADDGFGAAAADPVAVEPAPAPVAASGPGWVALGTDARGRPARPDPCRPLEYVVNTDGAPSFLADDLLTALQVVADASGVSFVSRGATLEQPAVDRPASQPERYGGDWAPLLVAWAAPDHPLLAGGGAEVLAVAVPEVVETDAGPVVVTGQLVVSEAAFLERGTGRGSTLAEVLAHEVGHLMGLGHVGDPTALMAPYSSLGELALTEGDRAGFRSLGVDGGCVTVPSP